jgi:Mg-chelatase subunit ChlD
MEWLTPLTGIYAAAIAVPALLLLYFLKLKRREQVVSSTLLWKRAVQDLQVNAPFQRLRRNILLLLQLLALLAMLVALAGPILSLTGGPGERYVVLIDRSASMSATDTKPTRLEAAKSQAKTFVQSMRSRAFFSLGDRSDQTMVIAFDKHAKVMCNFTSDKRQLISAVDAIEPGDGSSALAEAVVVARAFAQAPGVEGNIRTAEEPAQLILFSDGQIQDLDQIVVASDELVFHSIGQSPDNVGITAMQAKRSYEKPEEVDVFASLANYSDASITSDVQLIVNGDVRAVRSVTIPPAGSGTGSDANRPGQVAVNFTLAHAGAGVLEVRQLHPDFLSSDDAAWAVLSPPKRLSVLLVSNENAVLKSALEALLLARLDPCSPAGFDAMDHAALEIEQPYDVIVLDNHIPAHLPKCRYLVFGRPPNGIDVSVPQQLENQVIVDWRPRHPVLTHANLTNLFAAQCYQMDLPRDADVLAEFNDSAALAVLRRSGSVFLLAGFDILQTNWPFEPSFVLFCYNAVSFLGVQVTPDRQTNLRVGDPIIIDGLPAATGARVDGPHFSGTEIASNPVGSIRFPGTHHVGVYRVRVGEQPMRCFAVNMLDSDESNIGPRSEITLSGQSVEAQDKPVMRANVPLWPFLVICALVLASLEWLVYNLKAKI